MLRRVMMFAAMVWIVILAAVAMAMVGAVMAMISGCSGMPAALSPAATVAPVNEGTIETQTIDQTQETIANHALDAGRVDVAKHETTTRAALIAGLVAAAVGFGLILLAAPSPCVNLLNRRMMYLAGLAVIAIGAVTAASAFW